MTKIWIPTLMIFLIVAGIWFFDPGRRYHEVVPRK